MCLQDLSLPGKSKWRGCSVGADSLNMSKRSKEPQTNRSSLFRNMSSSSRFVFYYFDLVLV
jgi:hypothetical protein